MGGGGVRSKETGQLAGQTRGTKGDGRNERRQQMGGGGVRRGNATFSGRPNHDDSVPVDARTTIVTPQTSSPIC